jgi:hypothetical protein
MQVAKFHRNLFFDDKNFKTYVFLDCILFCTFSLLGGQLSLEPDEEDGGVSGVVSNVWTEEGGPTVPLLHTNEEVILPYRQSARLFLQSYELGYPHSLTRRRVCPPPFVSGGRTHLLAGKGMGGGVCNSDEGTDTAIL